MERSEKELHHINEFELETLVLHTTTALRLLDLGSDVFTLYFFYVLTAKRQQMAIGRYTNSIKATETYCRNGLHWGEQRFRNAKKVLVEEGFVENKKVKTKLGNIEEHYIVIHYLASKQPQPIHPSNQPLGQPATGFDQPLGLEATNTVEYSRNTVDILKKRTISKDINPLPLSSPSHYRTKIAHSTFTPLTVVQLWEIAKRKNVSLKDVSRVHENVLISIQDGNKYKLKDISRAVSKWVDRGIQQHNLAELDETGKMELEFQDPNRIRRLLERLEK